jgi:hypothetical protein
MSETPYGVAPGGQWPPPGALQGPPPSWPATAPRQSRTLAIISLVMGVIAIALAAGSWLKPGTSSDSAQTSAAPKQFTQQQTSDADKALCAAYHKMIRSVNGAGSQTSDDPVLQQVYAVNIRVATDVAHQYILSQINANPASSPQLTSDMQELADSYNEVLMAQLASAPKAELDPLYSRIDVADAKVVEACK